MNKRPVASILTLRKYYFYPLPALTAQCVHITSFAPQHNIQILIASQSFFCGGWEQVIHASSGIPEKLKLHSL